AIGVAGNFVLGAFMTLGIGLYAPCMILVSLLGLNARAAFPIMMGSCGFLTLVAGMRFVARNAYAPRAALGLTLGGTPAGLVPALVSNSLGRAGGGLLVVGVVVSAGVAVLRWGRVGEAPPGLERRDARGRGGGEA